MCFVVHPPIGECLPGSQLTLTYLIREVLVAVDYNIDPGERLAQPVQKVPYIMERPVQDHDFGKPNKREMCI